MANRPRYKLIQEEILSQIAQGKYRVGSRLPTEFELMNRYGVSRITVQKALSELRNKGILLRRARVGTFVRQVPQSHGPRAAELPKLHTPGRVLLGVVASFDMSASAYRYLNGIMSALVTPRDSIQLHNTGDDAAVERRMLENCLADRCDGILYYPGNDPTPPLDLLTQIAEEGFPCVLLDKQIYGVPLPCVQTDNVSAGYDITSALIAAGHKKIAFIQGGFESSVRERYLGFCRALRDNGLFSLERICYNIREYKEKKRPVEALIEQLLSGGCTALCCSADMYAGWVLDACRAMGVDVPGRLSVGSVDGSSPDITSMRQPYERIGHAAAATLLDWVLTGEIRRETTLLPATLLEGGTIAPNQSIEPATGGQTP